MLKTTRSVKGICATEGILFRREDLENIYQMKELKKRAEQNAQKIVCRARGDAIQIRQTAFSAGYHQGFQVALGDIIEYVNNNEQLVQQVRKEITEDIRASLLALCSKTDIMLACVSDWLEQVENSKADLHIVLPERYQPDEKKIIGIISMNWSGDFDIEYSAEQSQVILFCGSSVVEFNPPEYVENMVDFLSSKYDFEIHSKFAEISRKTSEKLEQTVEVSNLENYEQSDE